MHSNRSKKFIFFLADIVLFYLALFLTLTIRYGSFPSKELWYIHQWPFAIIYFIWIIIFYIAGLYDIEKFISAKELRNRVFKTMLSAGLLAIMLFYLIPSLKITPRINLVTDGLIIFIFIWAWRGILFNSAIKSSKIKIFFLGADKEIDDFVKFINERPQLGYKTINDMGASDIIAVSEQAKKNLDSVQSLYELIRAGKTVMDFDKFYESVTGKIPVSLISKTWFLENLIEINKQTFEKFKRVVDIIFSIILFIPFIIVYPFATLAIKINSKGPVFYKQKRMGRNGKIFEILKFRSMVADAEKNGAEWAKENDKRITVAGNILRKTRIDELPQIWNVLRGDLSFVGPRPERPEFVGKLEKQIPHYSMRHLVRPGLSGWAQINFPYGASVEDATEKMQYDLYYIKNRSFLLEISIMLKTIMTLLSHSGR
ncbi:exopolysaccharide biosynthesis polyprenyl glycosylphosphotransferase [Patescibacteria group bacterium]|nr:exopolysaccharide biosynthesis polyprenyl glycosylphosphotransferase [Patescibacteria group bacterium]MBU2263182.1 exopolysaccharide biosynthesis polyprenyl glycosylphosphotransferase [Patescibacteria group bacterium]